MKRLAWLLVAVAVVGCAAERRSNSGASAHAATAAPLAQHDSKETMTIEITPEEAKQKLVQGEAILLDVREPWEVETASVAGATLIPMGEIQARQQELDPEKNVLVLCHHGVRSLKVTNWLREHGFAKAQSVRGGIDAWSKQVDPKVPVY
jgi:rhodanese-related sulfurtransferase